jgi:hypothetical protein
LLGVEGYHDNCRDNLHAALAALGVEIPAEGELADADFHKVINLPFPRSASGG